MWVRVIGKTVANMATAIGGSSFGRRALRYVLRHVLVPETLEVDLGWRGITLYNFQVRPKKNPVRVPGSNNTIYTRPALPKHKHLAVCSSY